MKKKRRPRWMRLNASCPDCGLIVTEDGAEFEGKLVKCWTHEWRGHEFLCIAFDCPRCKVHYTSDEFWKSYHDKNAHVWAEHGGEPAHVEEV